MRQVLPARTPVVSIACTAFSELSSSWPPGDAQVCRFVRRGLAVDCGPFGVAVEVIGSAPRARTSYIEIDCTS
jgi:hypothetical protein